MPGALSHIRVLDPRARRAWCGQILGDLGAEVIKVERPDTGDDTRHWGPPYLSDQHGENTSEAAYYLTANRNKQSLTVDFTRPGGPAHHPRAGGAVMCCWRTSRSAGWPPTDWITKA